MRVRWGCGAGAVGVRCGCGGGAVRVWWGAVSGVLTLPGPVRNMMDDPPDGGC